MLGEKLADGLGELSALAGPVVDAIALEVNGGGLGAGVVGTDHFDRTAIAGAIFFDNNDAIVGLLAGANARQTNHQHRVDPLKKLDVFRVAVKCAGRSRRYVARGDDRHNRRTRKSEHLSIADLARFSNGWRRIFGTISVQKGREWRSGDGVGGCTGRFPGDSGRIGHPKVAMVQ
jgi:hypothetical protein